MKKVKLLLTIAAIVFATMICCSMSAFALTDGDWEFQLLDNEVTITKYTGDNLDVAIPDTIFGVPVTNMNENTFGSYVGDIKERITSVVFPKHMKVIPNNILNYAYNLTNVTIPEGVTTIGDRAFGECKNLETIKLPSTLTHINSAAFSKCESLSNIEIPTGLQFMGPYVFNETGLVSIDLSNNSFDNNSLAGLFSKCKNLESVKLNPNLDKIFDNMFYGCSSLKNVEIPGSVTDIERNAFYDCTSLKNIIMPVGLKRIEDYAFHGCTSLKELVIPYGTEYIEIAFEKCSNLESLFLPDTIKDISDFMLKDSPNAIVYCSENSNVSKMCKLAKISYLTDNSVNSGIHVLYNGTRISFHSYGQNPELLESRTLVPLRSIFEAMGADVEWDGDTSTAIAKRDGIEIKIQIGANEMYKDGKAIPVDVPAMLLNSRTMVPVRVIAEAFGADVQWNGNGRTVLITE